MSRRHITNQETRENLMLEGPISETIIKMAIPSIISFLITSVYNLADTFFVSGLGESATAAVSVNASLDQIIMMAGSMLAVGSASYISRLLGAKSIDKANSVLSTAFFLAALFGALVTILGTVFIGPLVRLLGATNTCERYARDYAAYVLLVAPFMATNFVMNQCLRAEGSAARASLGMGIGGVLNCFLDPLFISAMDMGVAGASLATAISKLISFVILAFPYASRRSILHLSIRNFCCSRDIIEQIFTVGSSSLFRSGFAVVSTTIINNIAGGISDSVLAGIGVSNKIMMFPVSIILGFGTGFQPVVGFNWGAEQYKRVKESYRFAAWTAVIGSIIMGLGLGIFANQLIALFGKNGQTVAMWEIGALCIRMQCLALPIHGWVDVVNMLCSGLGNAKGAVLLSTSRQGSCFLPIVYPMSWLWGANGIAAAQATADILSILLAFPLINKIKRQIQAVSDAQK